MRALSAEMHEGVESTPPKMHKYTVMPAHTLANDSHDDRDSPSKHVFGGESDKLRLFEVVPDGKRSAWWDPASYTAQGSLLGGSAGWRAATLLALLSTVLAFGALLHERSSGAAIARSPSGELLQRLEAFERDASAQRDAHATVERRQRAELQKLKASAEAGAKAQEELKAELASLGRSLHRERSKALRAASHGDQGELALEVARLRKALESMKDDLSKERQERKDFQGELKESEKVPEDNMPCQDADIGTKCFENVVWARTEGIRVHPGWYGHLSKNSSFKEFQLVLYKNGLYGCRKPCDKTAEGDHRALQQGEPATED